MTKQFPAFSQVIIDSSHIFSAENGVNIHFSEVIELADSFLHKNAVPYKLHFCLHKS